MIHENFVQVSPIVTVHGEAARLGQSINDGRVSMIRAISLDSTETKLA